MTVMNPAYPQFPVIRYVSALGPASPYPRTTGSALERRIADVRRLQEHASAVATGFAATAVAFAAGFLGGLGAAVPTR